MILLHVRNFVQVDISTIDSITSPFLAKVIYTIAPFNFGSFHHDLKQLKNYVSFIIKSSYNICN